MAEQREVISNFIRNNGSVLPVQIAKHLNTNILFASAMLSELVSSRTLKISHASIGGSPLYYLPGQEASMDTRLSASLNGIEKEMYNILKENKVLRENSLEPKQRVAVRNLKDFAVLISVKENDVVENFWKYHLINDSEAKEFIEKAMSNIAYLQPSTQEIVDTTKQEQAMLDVPKPQVQNVIEEPEIKREMLKPDTLQMQLIEEPRIKIERHKSKKDVKIDSEFYEKIIKYMKNNDVEILKEEVIKKNKEFNFVVNINSGFGKLRYLIKARNKSSITETDVSMAFSDGQIKKLPVIFLTGGKINKKASLLIEQKMQGQLVLKEV